MKNIHVLSTDKPSRLSILNSGKLNFGVEFISSSNSKAQNIYITSDEEIKVGDWFYNSFLNEISKMDVLDYSNFRKKIILTDNKDLIKDGVQAIPDEFLEWFVKNPSCESVGVEKFHGVNTSIAEVNAVSGDGSLNWEGKSDLRDYKIIIPQEEPKQETLEEAAEKLVKESFSDTFKKFPYGGNLSNETISESLVTFFKLGAKRQQEQNDTSKVKRVEVIQHSPPYNGRAFTNYNAKDVEIQFQDDGRTLKIFLK